MSSGSIYSNPESTYNPSGLGDQGGSVGDARVDSPSNFTNLTPDTFSDWDGSHVGDDREKVVSRLGSRGIAADGTQEDVPGSGLAMESESGLIEDKGSQSVLMMEAGVQSGSALDGRVPEEVVLIVEEGPEIELDPTADIPAVIKDNMKYMSRAQIRAARYLQKKNIFEFFNYLLGHLLSATPKDPIQFLVDLLDRCLAYRDGTAEEEDVEPPLLFTPQHVEVLFKKFDPLESGKLTVEQYRTAMMTMGIKSYNQDPPEVQPGFVAQEDFADEVDRCLTQLLNEMLGARRPESMAVLPEVALPEGEDADVTTRPDADSGTEPEATADALDPNALDLTDPDAAVTADPGAEVTADPGAEVTADPGAEVSAEPGAEDTAEPGAEDTAEPGMEFSAEPEVEFSAEPEVEVSADWGAEVTEEPNAEIAEEPPADTITDPDAAPEDAPPAEDNYAAATPPRGSVDAETEPQTEDNEDTDAPPT